MEANRFVSNAAGLVSAAMAREAMFSTSLGGGVAFPHVRGVEGGPLTLAIGTSRQGIDWDGVGDMVNIVCFSVIPVAVSPFYLRLMGALTETFLKPGVVAQIVDAQDRQTLWKTIIKSTRHTVK